MRLRQEIRGLRRKRNLPLQHHKFVLVMGQKLCLQNNRVPSLCIKSAINYI